MERYLDIDKLYVANLGEESDLELPKNKEYIFLKHKPIRLKLGQLTSPFFAEVFSEIRIKGENGIKNPILLIDKYSEYICEHERVSGFISTSRLFVIFNKIND